MRAGALRRPCATYLPEVETMAKKAVKRTAGRSARKGSRKGQKLTPSNKRAGAGSRASARSGAGANRATKAKRDTGRKTAGAKTPQGKKRKRSVQDLRNAGARAKKGRTGGTGREEELDQTPQTGRTVQGRTNPMGKQVWKLGICPSMLGDADALDAVATTRRDKVQDRVEKYNEILEEVCAKDRRCRFDGGAVFDFRFGTAQLSHWDWFHPSKNGQARLAEIAYRNVTAKSPVT